jgi:CDI immunity proteins
MESIEQLEGVWPEPESPTGLMLRCHAARKKPIDELSDLELATLLNQDIGVRYVLPEAMRRLAKGRPDETEYFDGQLKEAVAKKA